MRVFLALILATAAACSQRTTSGGAEPTAVADAEPDPPAAEDLSGFWQRVDAARSAPHAAPISSLAISSAGKAAATIDKSMRVRVWPSLSAATEPVDPEIDNVGEAALARTADKVILATLDTAGTLRITSIDKEREVQALHVSLLGPPNSGVIVLPGSGTTAVLTAERSIRFFDATGAVIGDYDARSFRPVRLLAVGPNELVAAEVSATTEEVNLKLTPIRLEPGPEEVKIIAGTAKELSFDGSVGTLAIGPGKKHVAAIIQTPKKEVSVVVASLEDDQRIVAKLGTADLSTVQVALGFVAADHVVAALPTGMGTWTINTKTGKSKPMAIWSPADANSPRAVAHDTVLSVHGVGLHIYYAPRARSRFLTYRTFAPSYAAGSPSGDHMVYQSGDDVYLYDSKTNVLRSHTYPSMEDRPSRTFFVDDETIMFVTSLGQVQLVDRASGETLASVNGPGLLGALAFDPIGKRLVSNPRSGELWVFEVANRNLSGPLVLVDGSNRAGFLDGDQLWTLDPSNIMRTYTLAEIRAGVSRQSATARGKRIVSVHPQFVDRAGRIGFSYYNGTQRFGMKSIGAIEDFGAKSVVEGQTPLDAKRQVQVDVKEDFPNTGVAMRNAFLSPDGSTVAIFAASSVNIYDAKTFKLKWAHPADQMFNPVSWNAGGKLLGLTNAGGVSFLEAESGETHHRSCGPVFVVTEGVPPMLSMTRFNTMPCMSE